MMKRRRRFPKQWIWLAVENIIVPGIVLGMNRLMATLCLTLTMAIWVATRDARAADLVVRGFVRDQTSRSPISGAMVSVAGAKIRTDQVTDDRGFFRLSLPELTPGGLIRLRVQRDGFVVYDQNVGASGELPLDIALVRSPSAGGHAAGRGRPPDTTTALLLAQSKSPEPTLRAAAVLAFGERGITDSAALSAIERALADTDFHVRVEGLDAVKALKTTSASILARVTVLLHDPEVDVLSRAASVIGLFGARARTALPDLLALLVSYRPNVVVRDAVITSAVQIGEHADPRLLSAIISRFLSNCGQDSELVTLLGRYPTIVTSRLTELSAKLDAATLDDDDSCEKRGLIRILSSERPAGRKILADYTLRLRGERQAEFIVLWISIDRGAGPDIRAIVPPEELASKFGPLVESSDDNWNSVMVWPDGHIERGRKSRPLRTAAALLTLDVDRQHKGWDVFKESFRDGESSARARFALEVLPSFQPETIRRGLATAIEVLADCGPAPKLALCSDKKTRGALGAVLADFGDATTIAALGPLLQAGDPNIRQLAQSAATAIEARSNQRQHRSPDPPPMTHQ